MARVALLKQGGFSTTPGVPQLTRILIVEDEPILAMELEGIVEALTGADVAIASDEQTAEHALLSPVDFAFLDINIRGGTSYQLARGLVSRGTPFAFASSVTQLEIPSDLRFELSINKPYCESEVVDVLEVSLSSAALGKPPHS